MTGERIHSINEIYLSLPLKGVADFGGVAHRFSILGLSFFDWTRPDWYFEGKMPGHNLYDLVPVSAPLHPRIVRHGHFYLRQSLDDSKPDDLSLWEKVEWKPLSIQERLDRICDAQRGAGQAFGLPRDMCFLIGRFYLNEADLDQIRSLLKPEPEKPNVGQVGRYRGIAVFPLSARPVVPRADELPIAEYEGVCYGYCNVDHAD